MGNWGSAVRCYEEIAAAAARGSLSGDVYALSFYRKAKIHHDLWKSQRHTIRLLSGEVVTFRQRAMEDYRKFLSLWGDANPPFRRPSRGRPAPSGRARVRIGRVGPQGAKAGQRRPFGPLALTSCIRSRPMPIPEIVNLERRSICPDRAKRGSRWVFLAGFAALATLFVVGHVEGAKPAPAISLQAELRGTLGYRRGSERGRICTGCRTMSPMASLCRHARCQGGQKGRQVRRGGQVLSPRRFGSDRPVQDDHRPGRLPPALRPAAFPGALDGSRVR